MKKSSHLSIILGLIGGFIASENALGWQSNETPSWSILGSLGYTFYEAAYSGTPQNYAPTSAIGDGETALGRFAIARSFWTYDKLNFGLETGIQSGNQFRLNISQPIVENFGGLLPQITIKPQLDLLATMHYQPQQFIFMGILKLGVAWRRMQIDDRNTLNDLSQAGFEAQLGAGCDITPSANLSLNYQFIYNGQANFTYDSQQQIGHISNIPNQNGILLSLAYTI